MNRPVKIIFCTAFLAVFAYPAPAATYYISKSLGSDSNTSTQARSKSTPWAHLPGMQSCAANCASYTPQPGDSFILRGGDTWVASDLGINWHWSGTSGSPIYIGVDQTWYSGSSWTRPIWTCGGTACTNTNVPSYDLFADNWNSAVQYYTLDNIELTGFNTAADGAMVQIYGSNVTVENIYAHGWNHNGESFDSGSVFAGSTCCGGGANLTFHNDIADGSDTTGNSMVCLFGQITNVYDNVCKSVTNGIEGAFDNIHDNWLGPINYCFPSSGCHQNAIQQAGPASSTNNVRVYNNVITGVASGGMGHLWVAQSADNSALNTYVFGNVMFNNEPGNDVDICQEGPNCGTFYFFNNTFECGNDANTDDCIAIQGSGSGPITVAHFANNHWITAGPSGKGITVANDPNFSFTETTDLVQTVPLANSQGYLSISTYAFQPASGGGGSTVGQGTNEQSLCATINGFDATAGAACQFDTSYACAYNTSNHTVSCPAMTEIARPSSAAWDIGAYQYAQQGSSLNAPTSLTSIVQ